nr:helix-turn-helix transcriptional regulator [Phytoactinopolyspora alkaliphila]
MGIVAVATRAALTSLADVVERFGPVTVADAEQPLTALVRTLDRALRRIEPVPEPVPLAESLRAREEEARRFEALTSRELDMLSALLAGQSAAEIAARELVSLPTVRSHIHAVLTKLRVSSQVAAVALTYRSCREAPVLEQMRRIQQF